MLSTLLWTSLAVFLINQWLQWRRAIRSVGGLPGYRSLVGVRSGLMNFLPYIPGISPGDDYTMVDKHFVHERYGADIVSAIGGFPVVSTTLILSDADAIKKVASSRARFPKPVDDYGALALYGQNIVITEHGEWKKFRKIAAPAFSEKNNRMVWEVSLRVTHDLFNEVWKNEDRVVVNDCVHDITLPIALYVISNAGFGMKMSWADNDGIPPNHQMTLKSALLIVTTKILLKLFVPGWALGLTENLRNVDLGFKELGSYMEEMVRERQSEEQGQRHDLLSNLVEANSLEDEGAQKLTEEELIGNIFVFLVAGHETTAHTLGFTLPLLALYQDEQEKLYQQVQSVLDGREALTYDMMPSLTYPLAAMYETLRMFPPVPGIPKISAEDTIFTTQNSQGEKITIPVPKGTYVSINAAGLHFNPRYWEDPHTFKPSRFLGDWPREAFAPFSVGSRACIGRRFSETEGVAVLSTIISQYKVEILESHFAGMTFEQKREQINRTTAGITLTPIPVPLVFKRRTNLKN